MTTKILLGLAALLALARPVRAQDVNLTSIYFLPTSCHVTTGSGAPSGGTMCDGYIDVSTGDWYTRGASAWVKLTVTGAALTRTNDTNVTLTLGGSPTTALVNAASITVGWSGTLAYDRGGCGAWTPTSGGVVIAGASACSTDTDLTFATDTLTATKVSAPTSVTTPTVTAAANLTLSPTGDLITDPSGHDILPATNYDINIGSPSFKYLSLSVGELIAETLVAENVMATIGGRVVVAPTTELTSDLAPAGTSISVKHNNLANGDRVFLQSAPGGAAQFEAMAITSAPSGGGPYTYSVTRNLDGSGANQWYAGDAVLNTGTTGDGYLDLYSNAGLLAGTTAGPTIVGNVRTGTTFSDIEPRWAIGNLTGLYGYTATGCAGSLPCYGAAFGVPTGAWIKVDPTNGVRIGYDTTVNSQVDASGNASFAGAVTASSGAIGGWTIGSNELATSDGYIRLASGVHGVSAITIGTGSNLAGLNSPAAASDVAIWAGAAYADKATAPFRVLVNGNTFANDVTLGVGSTEAYDYTHALKFVRNTSGGFGQTGDVFSIYGYSTSTVGMIAVEDVMVGTGANNGIAHVMLRARGWDTSGGGVAGGEGSIAVTGGRDAASSGVALRGGSVNFGGGTDAIYDPLVRMVRLDAVTDSTIDHLTLSHRTSGTAAAGLGTAIAFQSETSTTNDELTGRIASYWTTVTHGSRTSTLGVQAVSSATTYTAFELVGAGRYAVNYGTTAVQSAQGVVALIDRWRRPQDPGVKYANTADWKLGTWSGNTSAESRLDLCLSNGGTDDPDNCPMIWYSDGRVFLDNGVGTGTGGNYLCVDTTSYEILRGNGSTCTASAGRFKQDVRPLAYGLDVVRKLRPVSFAYRPETHMGTGTHLGFIAEDVNLLVPEVVTRQGGRVYGLNYDELVAVLARAVQDLDRQVQELKAKVR